MGNTPAVTLDKTTLQPISIPKSASGAPATAVPAPSTIPSVTLDKSTLKRINPTEPEQGFWRGSPSVPGQAIEESLTMSPQKMKEGAVTAGKTALAGAAAGSAAIGAAGVLAPTATTELIGTGVLDATGEEIMREITRYGPSVARQVFTHPLAQQALKYAVGAAGGGAILKWLGLLGKAAE